MIEIIGLGEIGFEMFKELDKKIPREKFYGIDISDNRLNEIKNYGFSNVGKDIKQAEIYILSVYLTEQIFDVLDKIMKFDNYPLIVIESTVMPGTYKEIINKYGENKFDLVLFPHRYNPNDSEHHVFNQKRVIGGNKKSLIHAKEFFKQFIDWNLVHETAPEIAELTKPVENAYRFIEIAIAQELKMLCKEKNIDFEKLREAANTKWNINLKEAREGIGGKCLPKDINLINEFFIGNDLFKTAIESNEKYKRTNNKG